MARLATLLLTFALAAAPSAIGQEAFGQETFGQEPEPIPPSAVADRADALSRQLRQTRERLQPSEEVETVAAELEARAAAIEERRGAADETLAEQTTLAQLAELERGWARQAEELQDWRGTLTARAAELEAEVDGLDAASEVWKATLATVRSSGAPSVVVSAVRRSISDLDEARAATSKRRGEVLALQNRVSEQELAVAEVLETVQRARSGLRSRLLEPDQPPIWSAMVASRMETRDRLAAAFASTRTSVLEFIELRSERLITVGVLFVLALLASFGLQRSVAARRAAGGEIEQSSGIFRRPIALATLLTLLGTFWLFPLAPAAFRNVVGLLLLVPLLRFLPELLHPGFRSILYGIAVLYVVDRLRDALGGAPLEGRIVFAVECAAAAAVCVALLRPARLAQVPDPDRFPRWPARAVRASAAIFIAALAANVLGYLGLAELLGEGLLTTIYLAVGLYAAARVLGIVLNVTTKTDWAQQIHFLRARRAVAVDWIRWGIAVGAGALWVYLGLGAFGIQDAVIGSVTDVLTTPLSLGAASVSLADVLLFALTVTAAIVISRIVRFVLMEDVFSRVRTGRGIPYAVSASAHYAILFAGFLLALAVAGIDMSRFTLLAGAFGVGIGFGLQNVVNNFVSGLILLYERPIQVGDMIDMGDLLGQVKRIGIRSSTVRSLTGAEVIVPNADLISNRVINWTLSDKHRRIDVPIGVKYGTDPDRVLGILRAVADAHERVLKYPAPVALFRAHGSSSLDFELRVWIANFDDSFEIESEVNAAINAALNEADIEIPFPQRDLHLRTVDEPAARTLGPSEQR